MNQGKLVFAQFTYRESLRDIEACLRAQASKRYHMGLRGNVARNTLANANSRKDFEAPLRRIRFRDPESGKRLVFLTNNFALPALTITKLYRLRWRVELFFKWIKQHLRIKAF